MARRLRADVGRLSKRGHARGKGQRNEPYNCLHLYEAELKYLYVRENE